MQDEISTLILEIPKELNKRLFRAAYFFYDFFSEKSHNFFRTIELIKSIDHQADSDRIYLRLMILFKPSKNTKPSLYASNSKPANMSKMPLCVSVSWS